MCVCTRQHVKSLRTLLVARVIEEIGHFFMVLESSSVPFLMKWCVQCLVWCFESGHLFISIFLFFFLLFYSKNKLPDQKIYVVLLFCLDFRFSSLAFDWMIFILIHSVNFRFIFYFCLHLNVFFPLILFLFQIWSFFLYIFCKMYDFIFNFTLKSNNAIFPLVLFLFISSSDYFILLFFFQFHPPTLCYLGIKGRGFF